ncbi:sigma-70 family RNA polymerase sigma factor [Motilibacter deserti]|uniref:Sigma-70 family RNA polymerase sigma factor n=1 Tax=Motilibacter deserti TaxID=2714956 RepID=A0ABX0H3S8_9ACTN|nr:sigma-70 family RNA polymerase sigma factor [Motilibacter deserti]NHC16424.1 sigma-70 family RNA polymerase sigma factor [Motilibacter deserti]
MAQRTADEPLLRALWEEHGSALLAYAQRLTGDRGRAEDIVQETLLRAWRHGDELDTRARSEGGGGAAGLRGWLFTVARHLAVDAHRARLARPREAGDDTVLAALPASDEIERALDSWLVADALAALSPAHREVLVETYYCGRSVAEAAAVLGVPPGTVKSRAHYALRALRLALEERGVTP